MLKATYYCIFNKDLTWLMRSELSGDYREIILLALDVRTDAARIRDPLPLSLSLLLVI